LSGPSIDRTPSQKILSLDSERWEGRKGAKFVNPLKAKKEKGNGRPKNDAKVIPAVVSHLQPLGKKRGGKSHEHDSCAENIEKKSKYPPP